MKILADLHHTGLYHSLEMLLEDRLGHELYRPIGIDWFNYGYWKIAEPYKNNAGTIRQYLDPVTYHPADGTPALTSVGKSMSFSQFLDTDIDVVIASIPAHVATYDKLIKEHKPRVKLIHQMGNEWPVDFSIVKNLMASTMPFAVPSDVNAVFYYQEFPLYERSQWGGEKILRSFVNTLSHAPNLQRDWLDFVLLEEQLPDYTFESYGGSCRNGFITRHSTIAEMMSECVFGVHFKNGGDGYGHVIHQWASLGIPLIVKGSQYKGKLAERLLFHLDTCIDIEKCDNTYDKIRMFSETKLQTRMRERMKERFDNLVNFEAEAERIDKFLCRML